MCVLTLEHSQPRWHMCHLYGYGFTDVTSAPFVRLRDYYWPKIDLRVICYIYVLSALFRV